MKSKTSDRTPIYVTRPSLPPLEEVTSLLEGVWERGILTNNGPLVQKLENELETTLGVPRFVAVTNGTIALQMAIRAMGLSGGGGEIIISSFTWVAAVSAIKWEGCVPVCGDIDPETLNLDPARIESLITDRTVAIMPVHVFGNPCDLDAIQSVADTHGLKVIYDAAHAIGSTWNGASVLSHGDISATSLHATKLLNTGEGGGCVTRDPALGKKLERIRFIGLDKKKGIVEDGFNGKMTEIHAALGLANLRNYEAVLADRKHKHHVYLDRLQGVPGLHFQKPQSGGESNCSYFPVIFEDEGTLLRAVDALAQQNIHPRRYFHPSVNTFSKILPYQPTPIAEDISKRILCLPHYFRLEETDMAVICDTIQQVVRSQ